MVKYHDDSLIRDILLSTCRINIVDYISYSKPFNPVLQIFISLEIHYCFDNFHNEIQPRYPRTISSRQRIDRGNDKIGFCPSTRIQRGRNPWPWHHRVLIFERSNDSTTTDDENSCARVNHVSADIFIQRDRTVGRNETEEEAQAELHNATRETQEWKKPLAVGKWPWARYRSVFGHDGFIVEIYTLYTPLRIVISKVERISRGMFIYINIYISIVRFDNGRVFPEKNSRIVFWIRLWKDASNWKASWITCERKKLNDNPFSSVYDSRCYELWRRECNVYFLAWRCNNSGEEWLIVLFLQTMYLVPLGIFSLWDVLWPCFILNFCFTHLLLLLSIHTHTFITIAAFFMY